MLKPSPSRYVGAPSPSRFVGVAGPSPSRYGVGPSPSRFRALGGGPSPSRFVGGPTAAPSRVAFGFQNLEKKSPFLNMGFVEEQNTRENKDFALYDNFQVNPFNLEVFEYVTPKVGAKPPKIDPKTIPGYAQIRDAFLKASFDPSQKPPSSPTQEEVKEVELQNVEKYCPPAHTTNQNYGWFYTPGAWQFELDNKDERFRFGHKTADFIKEKEKLKKFDKMMGNSSSKGGAAPKSKDNKVKEVATKKNSST